MESTDDEPLYHCSMARFTIDSAQRGLDLIIEMQPHEELAFFLSMGLITNTRAIFFALANRDSKKSRAHATSIDTWRKGSPPTLKRFQTLIVAARNLFTKEFASTPLVVRTTSNYAPSTYEIPIYIPITAEIEGVLTEKERRWRATLSREDAELPMRISLLPECSLALSTWRSEIDRIESDIRKLLRN